MYVDIGVGSYEEIEGLDYGPQSLAATIAAPVAMLAGGDPGQGQGVGDFWGSLSSIVNAGANAYVQGQRARVARRVQDDRIRERFLAESGGGGQGGGATPRGKTSLEFPAIATLGVAGLGLLLLLKR